MVSIAVGVTILLFILLLAGMPVAFTMLITGAVGLYATGGIYPLIGVIKAAPYEHVTSYTLSTLPMFVLMAEFLTAGRFTRDLFTASHKWLGHMRGGIAYAAVAGGVMLSAVSGSSTAAAGTLAAAAHPEMRRYGYDDSFSTGALAVIGTLAIMIPPSIGLVLFGVFTETSVGALLMAGLLPGGLTAIGYAITIAVIVRRDPKAAPTVAEPVPMREKIAGLKPVWPILLLMALMLTAIYSGAITPTEVGAVGALAALVIAVAMGRMGWREFLQALASATRNSAMILAIIACSAVFGIFLTLTGVTQDLLMTIQAADIPPFMVLMCVLLLLLVLGFFLDQLAILVLTLPLTFPLLSGLGFEPVWLGILFVKAAEIGLITPPMGINVFVVASTTKVPVGKVFRGVWPFVLVELLILAILVAFPAISLWLPGQMR
ncbi:TRAP transporter large permease [Mesorhizobium sp. CAU 1741]|uniref:TRAP transporter large permease n=1 Tax=Mesorhizobium sp. CAU 1741 TaxID=3140366 RepID=UPI00325BDDD5